MKRMWRASRPSAAWFAAAPKAVGILLIVLGLVFAKLIEVALRYIPSRIRFDTLMERAGNRQRASADRASPATQSLHPAVGLFPDSFVLAKTAADALGSVAISNAIAVLLLCVLCAEHRRRASACDSRRIVGTIFGRPGCRIGAEFRDRFRPGR